MALKNPQPKVTTIELRGKELSMLRLDLLPSACNGNKWYKLKYTILDAIQSGKKRVLTFGGAYSNHIYALAAAVQETNLSCIGVIRGERTQPLNPTLKFAEECGMELHFIDRAQYREKTNNEFLARLNEKFGDFYLVPEGGSNELGIKGASEILQGQTGLDIVCVPVGTGGTMAGLINGKQSFREMYGFQVVRDKSVQEYIASKTESDSWRLIGDFDFGGYAKFNQKLIDFINAFKRDHSIQLDPIYTGKMMYGLDQMIWNQLFDKNTTILVVHTGGQQGIQGFNDRFGGLLN